MNLKGHILSATEEELAELVSMLDQSSSFTPWLLKWAAGEHQEIGTVDKVMETGPATPARVIAYYRYYWTKEDMKAP